MTAEQVTFLVASIVIGANLGWLVLYLVHKWTNARAMRERKRKRSQDNL